MALILATDPAERYVLADHVDVAAGRVNYGVVRLGDVSSISGTDLLFTIQFRMIGEWCRQD